MPEDGGGAMDVDRKPEPAGDLRVLAVFCNPEEEDPGYDPPGPGSTPTYAAARPGAKVEVMEAPSMAELAAKLEEFKPTMLYIRGSPGAPGDNVKGHLAPIYIANGPDKLADNGDLVAAMEEVPLDTVFLDAAAQEKLAELLRLRGVKHVIFWAEDPTALVAAHFAGAFFGAMALPRVGVVEAYTLALHSVQAQCGTKLDNRVAMPGLPDLLIGEPPKVPLLSGGVNGGGAAAAGGDAAGAPAGAEKAEAVIAVDEGVELELPDHCSVPPLELPGRGPVLDVAEAVPGWTETALYAPRADVRLHLCGGTAMLDAPRLSYLGEALRSLLVIEARAATLEASEALDPVPLRIGADRPGAGARRCRVRTASGAVVAVVLAGREGVLGDPAVLQYALRQTLVADALALQFRLPPVSTPLPMPKTSADVLGGVPCVETLVTNIGVWAVDALRQLAQKPQYTGLLTVGIAAVGSAAVQGASDAEVLRRKVIVTGARPAGMIGGAGAGGNGPSTNPLAVPADPPLPPHCCGRAPITEVNEEEFVADLIAFLGQRRGKPLDPSKFPDAVLNGSPLDVFVLYKEVVTRGGFRAGNGINWKGQVFAKMRNWTASNRQTGVGAALKKHYANTLWEYEQAHPADVLSDRCIICGSGEEQGLTDWIACDSCESWVHFSCDKRQGLGTFASYSGENGRTYTCPSCTRGRPGGGGSGSGGRGSEEGTEDEGEEAGGSGDGDDGDDPMDT